MISQLELEAIEARDKARTPGRWSHRGSDGTLVPPNWQIIEVDGDDWSIEAAAPHGSNLDWIIACSEDVPKLVAEVRRLQEVEAKVEQFRILAIFYRDLCIEYVSSQTLEREAYKSGLTLGELDEI